MGSLGIAIDGGRYVRIDSSMGDLYRNVRLSTVSAGQDSAKLDFCSFGRKGPVLRKSILLKGLSRSTDAPTELRLRVERRGFSLWNINARKPDGEYEDIRVRTGIGLWPLILLVILLLIFGLWFAFRLSSRIEQPVSGAPTPMSSDTSQPGESEASTAVADPETDETSTALPAFPEKTILIFQPESAALTGTAIRELDNLAAIIPENSGIEIGGHCAIFGTERGRERLSGARADAVADYLSSRIPDSVRIETRGYGGSRPITRDLELQDMNRRVEINVSGDNG